MFQKRAGGAKPWPGVQHQPPRWLLSSAGLGSAEPWCFCLAFPCVGLRKWFVPGGVCGAGSPRCLRTMIPRARGISQPGRGARSGDAGAGDRAAGPCEASGATWVPDARWPGSSRAPPCAPFSLSWLCQLACLGVPLSTKASSAPKKRLFLARLLDEARVPPSSSCTLLPPRWEALAWHRGLPVCSVGSCRTARGCGCAPRPAETPAEVCLSPRAQDHRVRQRLPADHPGEGSQHRCLQVRRPWAEGESSGAEGDSAAGR